MHALPSLQAVNSIYVGLPHRGGGIFNSPPSCRIFLSRPEPEGPGCSPCWQQHCEDQASRQFKVCISQGMDRALCHLQYSVEIHRCRTRWGCLTGQSCQPDARSPGGGWNIDGQGTCCPNGKLACWPKGCIDPCPSNQYLDSSCNCRCNYVESCIPPKVFDTTTCSCICPPCPGIFVQDPVTCKCTCPEPFTDCGGICVDLTISQVNCGGCGIVCQNGLECCAGQCSDVTTDPKHCGYCGNACPEGWKCCNGRCVNVGNDWRNCGECGKLCPIVDDCCGGECVNLETDDSNCGACGSSCPVGYKCCDRGCMDLGSNPNHCGACGVKCRPDQNCVGGTCICPTGLTDCNGKCVNLMTDRNNCGSCGNVCDVYEQCQNGKCVCPQGSKVCHGRCCGPPFLYCANQFNPKAPWHCSTTPCEMGCPPLRGESHWPSGYCAPPGYHCCTTNPSGICPGATLPS